MFKSWLYSIEITPKNTRKIKYLHFLFALSWHLAFRRIKNIIVTFFKETLFQDSVESGGYGREDQATQTDDEDICDTPQKQRVTSLTRPTSFICGEFEECDFTRYSFHRQRLKQNSKIVTGVHYKSCLWKVHFVSFRLLHWYCNA